MVSYALWKMPLGMGGDFALRSGSDTVQLDRTHSSLAEYFGVSRQALEREIKHMAADGLISLDTKKISLTDKRSLSRLIHS